MILSESRKLGRTYRYYVCTNAQRRGWKACPGKPIQANVIEESVLSQVTSHCKLGKRHRQEHVSALLHRLLQRVRYEGQSGGVTLEFRPAAGMNAPAPLTYILRSEKTDPSGREKRLPRLTRLLALAIKCEGLVRSGAVPDYAELARRGWVTRARITQIMNLLLLAPDIQEAILFLPRTRRGRDPIHLALLQPIARTWRWSQQRRRWRALCRSLKNRRFFHNCLEIAAQPR